jgi:hypothetical protein
LESSSCFLPSACIDPCDELIQLCPSSCGGGFLVNGVGRMIECGVHRRRELLKDRGATRSKGGSNRHRKSLGRSEQAGRPRPFLSQFGPVFLPAAHLHILDLAPLICVILRSSSPRSRQGVFSYEVRTLLVLGDDPSYHLGPCHL